MLEQYFGRSSVFCLGAGLRGEGIRRSRVGTGVQPGKMQQGIEISEIIVSYNAKGNGRAGRILIEIGGKKGPEDSRDIPAARFPDVVPVRYLRDLVYSGFRRFYFAGNGS
jgi:hypothetical protein